MKNCKSLIALVLVAALCLSSFVGISTADITASAAEAQSSENLIQNGDFENISKVTESGNNYYAAFGAWETGFAYGANLNASEYRSGSQSLKLLQERSYGTDFSVYQQIAVEKDTNYKLSFWFKSNETLACEVVTEHGFSYPYAESTNRIARIIVGKYGDTNPIWNKATIDFSSGDNETLYIQFDANALEYTVNADTHYAYIDDVSIEKNNDENLIQNGEFNVGTADWTIADRVLNGEPAQVVTHGNRVNVLKMATYKNGGDDSSAVKQTVSVKKYKTYYLTYFVYTDSNNTVDFVTSEINTEIRADNQSLKRSVFSAESSTAGKWTKVTEEFYTDEYETVEIKLDLENIGAYDNGNGFSCFYIDDVRVFTKNNGVADSGFIGFSNGNGNVFIDNNAGPFVADNEHNVITDQGFEDGSLSSGNWNNAAFLSRDGDYGIYLADADFKDGAAVNSGSYGIVFKAGENKVSGTFNVMVKPNTTYYFTTFVKMPAYNSETNKGTMSFGVTDAETGNFLAYNGNQTYYPFSDTYQAAPFSPDNEWHLISLKFNSGSTDEIGITIQGTVSEVYFDNMYLVADADKIRYVAENSLNRLNWEYASYVGETDLTDCESDKNLVTNSNCESGDGFWNDPDYSLSYGNFLAVGPTGDDSYGNALVYDNDEIRPDKTYYIRWVEVEKNTRYTFTADYLVEEVGKNEIYGDQTFFGIISADRTRLRVPKIVEKIYLNEAANKDNPTWMSVGFQFDTNADTDLIGIVFSNCGGKAYIDNISLFKSFDENGNNNGKIIKNGGFDYGTIGWDIDASASSGESESNTNLIANGDFENITRTNSTATGADIGAWKTGFGWGADVNKDEHHSGSQSLKLVQERSWGTDFSVYQQIAVEKNTAYKLTFWYKSNETLACEVVTKHGFTYPYGKSDIILAHTVVGTFNDSAPGWREITLNFNSGDNETLYVQFDANALANTVKDGTHYAYLDNVSLVKMVPHESAKVVSYGGRNNVLKMATYKSNNDSSAVKQTVIVKKNTTYCLTYEVYTGGANWVNNKPSVIYAEVIGGASTLSKQSFQATSSTQGKWTKTTLIFDSGENETVEIKFDLLNSGDYNDEQGTGFASFYIDDVGIYEKITGDVYVDDGTDSKDLVFLKKILLGIYSDQTNANVNNDEGIDIRDLVALKKLLCGLKAEN